MSRWEPNAALRRDLLRVTAHGACVECRQPARDRACQHGHCPSCLLSCTPCMTAITGGAA